MTTDIYQEIFTPSVLAGLFPADRSDHFFEALYGDVDEGVYDISLVYRGYSAKERTLSFQFSLSERPGKCLACHLTSGLPDVFARHPVIGVAGLVAKISDLLGGRAACGEWRLEPTRHISKKLYGVPLTIKISG